MARSKLIPAGELILGGIPVTEDVEKDFLNSHGYPCKDFGSRGVLNVQSLGCSWTQGSPLFGAFPQFVCEMLSERFNGIQVENWNMGLGGRSCDYMCRTLLCTADCLKPDIVLLNFTTPDRREYFRSDGRRILYQSDYIHEEKNNGPFWNRLSPVNKEIVGHLNALCSPYEDCINFLKNYKLIEAICNSRGIMWAWSMCSMVHIEDLVCELLEAGWLDRSHYLGSRFEVIDHLSETDHHPGKESHIRHARKLIDWLMSAYGERLTRLVSERAASPDVGSC